ncbi:MAG: parallel beta-helix domain-containing protein [Polyangiales bacterium]
MNFRLLTSVALAAVVGLYGCGDDSGTGGSAGDGGSGGSGGTGAVGGVGSGGSGGGVAPKGCDDIPDTTSNIEPNPPETTSDDCDETVTATGEDDQAQILMAILTVGANGVVCLEAGDYDMGGTVDITTTPGLTLKGIGATPDDVVLDYADDEGTCRGAQGINVTVDNVTIENMWVKNSCENAVVQRNVDGSVFRKVRVSWDGVPRTENGAYGIYPTDCSNTVVEYCQTQGASDAGVYIGKCDGGIVENNVVYENVAGLEVENCLNVDASANEIFDNTGGLLALQQDISSEMQTNSDNRLFDNEVYCNNRENFAQPGSAVSGIPVGTGGLSFGGNGIEFFGNQFTDNEAFALGLAANVLTCQVATSDCPPYSDGYDPYVQNVYIHDNEYSNNGNNPTGDFGDRFNQWGFGGDGYPPVPNTVWDGYQPLACDEGSDNAGDPCFSNDQCPNGACATASTGPNDAGICLGTDQAAASDILVIGDACANLSLNLLEYVGCAKENSSTDQAPYLCVPN